MCDPPGTDLFIANIITIIPKAFKYVIEFSLVVGEA